MNLIHTVPLSLDVDLGLKIIYGRHEFVNFPPFVYEGVRGVRDDFWKLEPGEMKGMKFSSELFAIEN